MTDSQSDPRPLSDAELIGAYRAGDGEARRQLTERHASAADAAARAVVGAGRRGRDEEISSLVDGGLARAFEGTQGVGGPLVAFRPFLLTCVRNAALRDPAGAKSERRLAGGAEDPPDGAVLILADRPEAEPHRAITDAFVGLPERWRLALWHGDVEGASPAQFAPLMGLGAGAATAVAHRARLGLRRTYLASVAGGVHPPECEATIKRLNVGVLPLEQVVHEAHLAGCQSCAAVAADVADIGSSLRRAVVPFFLGVPGHRYVEQLHGRGTRRRPIGRGARAAFAAAAAVVLVAGVVAATSAQRTNSRRQDSPTKVIDAGSGLAVKVSPTVLGATVSNVSRSSVATTIASSTTAVATVDSSTDPATTAAAVPITRGPTVPPRIVATTTTVASTVAVATTAVISTVGSAGPTAVVGAPASASLSIAGGIVGPVVAGRDALVQLSVTNAGPSSAESPVVSVTLPASLEWPATTARSDGSGWSCAPSADGRHGECTTSALAVGNSTISIRAIPIEPAVPGVVRATITDRLDVHHADDAVEVAIPAARPSGLAPLFSAFLAGGIATTGNSLLTCDGSVASCADALAGRTTNDDVAMVPARGAGAVSGVASSSATLMLPSSATIERAWLVWGATGGLLDAGSVEAVTLAADGQAPRHVTQPDRSDVAAGDVYRRVDVTDYLQAAPAVAERRYTMSVASGFGAANGHTTDLSAGWALVAVYRSAESPTRAITLLDGLSMFGGHGDASLDLPFGVLAPGGQGRRPVDVAVVAWNGDGGALRPGYGLRLNGRDLADRSNPAGAVFNGTVSSRAEPVAGRVPLQSSGFDADLIAGAVGFGDGQLNVSLGGPAAVLGMVRVGLVAVSADRA